MTMSRIPALVFFLLFGFLIAEVKAQGGAIRVTRTDDVSDLNSVFVIPGNSLDCDQHTHAPEALAQYAGVRLGEHYKVLERKYLDMVLNEQSLGMSGVIYEASAVEAGCLQGSEGVVFCDVGCLQGQSMTSIKLVNCAEGLQVWAASGINANVVDLMDEIIAVIATSSSSSDEAPIDPEEGATLPDSEPSEPAIERAPLNIVPSSDEESTSLQGTGEAPDDNGCTRMNYNNYDYRLIKVNEGCWMAENLRSDYYRDGTPISLGSPQNWHQTENPMHSIYGMLGHCQENVFELDVCNSSIASALFGHIYNGFAVLDPRQLCPAGWHIPTLGEWYVLESDFIRAGLSPSLEKAFRSSKYWFRNDGLDLADFTGLPGGYVTDLGGSIEAGKKAYWWTSSATEDSLINAVVVDSERKGGLKDEFLTQRYGLAVRCKKD